MNLIKFVFLTVILIFKVSCQQIIDSLTPNNLLPPLVLAHYKQPPQEQQFRYYKSDSNYDEEDNNNMSQDVMTPTISPLSLDSHLSLLDILKNQIVTNSDSKRVVTNNKNNKTKIFIPNMILYEWLMSPHKSELINHQNNNNNHGEDSWRYYGNSDEDDDNSINSDNIDGINQDKRSALRSARMSRRSQKKKEADDSFLPSISAGAMSKLHEFFDQLNTNIKTLETTPNYHHIPFADIAYLQSQVANNKKDNMLLDDYSGKPSGTAAFLHAIRSYRPSQKVRGLVALQPESYRGANFHDPNFLWQGLGK